MKTDTSEQNDRATHPFGPDQPQWRVWLARIVMISVLFVVLISAFSVLGVIVEKFFVVLYVDGIDSYDFARSQGGSESGTQPDYPIFLERLDAEERR